MAPVIPFLPALCGKDECRAQEVKLFDVHSFPEG